MCGAVIAFVTPMADSMAVVPFVPPSSPENAYSRLKADPMVGVGDISSFISEYFKAKGGARNLGALIEEIDKSQIGWKSAPQACLV